MQERQVTAGGRRHALPDPFFVLATQNPIEQEGTYPLPEAQLDRFLFKIFITYPDARGRAADLPAHHRASTSRRSRRCSPASGSRPCSALVRRVPVSDHCIDYAMDLVRATRGPGARRAGLHRRMGRLGRRPACRPVADPGRQGPRRAGRPAERLGRRHPRRRPAGAPPPHRHQLQRPGRRRVERLDRQEAPDRRPGPEGGRRCRRRGSIPILTSSPGSPT